MGRAGGAGDWRGCLFVRDAGVDGDVREVWVGAGTRMHAGRSEGWGTGDGGLEGVFVRDAGVEWDVREIWVWVRGLGCML